MNKCEFSYVILKYRHDVVADEVLNVGVLLYCPLNREVDIKFNTRFHRLSETFAHFDGELYREVLGHLQHAIQQVDRQLKEKSFGQEKQSRFVDAGALLKSIWSDQGLSYFAGPVHYGITSDCQKELAHLYERYVHSPHEPQNNEEGLSDSEPESRISRSQKSTLLRKQGSAKVGTFKEVSSRKKL